MVFDSESKWTTDGDIKTHTFRLAVGAWWDDKDEKHSEPTYGNFTDVPQLWHWVSDHSEPRGRTIVYAHNIGFDIQVCRMFESLPALGWSLEWFNLDRFGTLVTWRRGGASLVFADTYTLFPARLEAVAGLLGDAKSALPDNGASDEEWFDRCRHDVEITVAALREFNGWAREFDIGNWRPSGSGLAWAMFRHRFLSHEILASSSAADTAAERDGMNTGRAEAWKTGQCPPGGWFDWDMKAAYARIAGQVEVPVRWRMTVRHLTLEQYLGWSDQWAVLSTVKVTQDRPIVGVKDGTGFRWPVGTFETTLWDPEINLLLESGARVEFGESRRYIRAPALKAWSEWTLAQLVPGGATVPPTVGMWVKAQSRSLIGRFSMRYHSWEPHEDGNGIDMVGLSMEAGPDMPLRNVMHVGRQAWSEGPRTDGDDALPAITGYVMSECRVRLWKAIQAAGEAHVWHVDTDGLLVDVEGSERLWAYAQANPDDGWVPKGLWDTGELRATRNYTLGEQQHVAGVPTKALQSGDNEWRGEHWQGLAEGLRSGRVNEVRVRQATWHVTSTDSRRLHLDGGETRPFAPGEYDAMKEEGNAHSKPKLFAMAHARAVRQDDVSGQGCTDGGAGGNPPVG